MIAKRINSSSTNARYQIDMDTCEDIQKGLNRLVDEVEPFNYGYRIVERPSESRTIVDIYVN
jgi:hypothetical protein